MSTTATTVSEETSGRRQRRLTNLLLNRSFQLKYTGMVVGMSSLISIALGFFLVEQMRENSRMLQLETNLDAVFQEALVASDAKAIFVMIGALLLFNLILGLGAVFVTHRMAGPIFVLRRYIRMIGEGKLPKLRALRKGDEFGEVLETLGETVSHMEDRAKEELDGLLKVQTALSATGDEAAKAEVEKLIATRQKMLEH